MSVVNVNVHVLSCGRVPYPNDALVQGLTCSIDRGRLCEIRDVLFEERAVSRNAQSFPATYNGSTLGNDNRLSPRQLADLKRMLSSPPMDIDALVACKIILGRWLRPSEMAALFGERARLWTQRYPLSGAADDAHVSHAIGRAGSTLNGLTARSGCIYIWFGKGSVSVYARNWAALERARTLMNRHMATFNGDTKMVVEPSGASARRVTLKAVYRVLSSRG